MYKTYTNVQKGAQIDSKVYQIFEFSRKNSDFYIKRCKNPQIEPKCTKK